MEIFINIFGTTVFIAVVFFIVFLYRTIKIEEEKLIRKEISDTFDDVDKIAFRIVLNLNQTTVKRLKKEELWNKETAEIVFEQAIQKIKYQLGDKKLNLLNKKIIDVDDYLNSLIESIVFEIKENRIKNEVE